MKFSFVKLQTINQFTTIISIKSVSYRLMLRNAEKTWEQSSKKERKIIYVYLFYFISFFTFS